MATRTREDRRLRQLSAVCLGLPEAERTNCGPHADFRVRGKIFAYFLRNHGGDGITAACFKTRLGEHVEYVRQAPDRFYLPRFLGRRGWLGLRLDQGAIDWDEVRQLASLSYELAAPRGLRPPAPPLANALTGHALIAGTPPELAMPQRVLEIMNGTGHRTGLLKDAPGGPSPPPRLTATPDMARGTPVGAVRGRR